MGLGFLCKLAWAGQGCKSQCLAFVSTSFTLLHDHALLLPTPCPFESLAQLVRQ